jgi:hypothetical protein
MQDDQGWRHVTWWAHRQWDGVPGTFRCRDHSTRKALPAASEASRPAAAVDPVSALEEALLNGTDALEESAERETPFIVVQSCGHRRVLRLVGGPESRAASDALNYARTHACSVCQGLIARARTEGIVFEPEP